MLDFKNVKVYRRHAVVTELARDKKTISIQAKTRTLAAWNTVLNFIFGEGFFRPMLQTGHEDYVKIVKETLKFILVSAFTLDKKIHG